MKRACALFTIVFTASVCGMVAARDGQVVVKADSGAARVVFDDAADAMDPRDRSFTLERAETGDVLTLRAGNVTRMKVRHSDHQAVTVHGDLHTTGSVGDTDSGTTLGDTSRALAAALARIESLEHERRLETLREYIAVAHGNDLAVLTDQGFIVRRWGSGRECDSFTSCWDQHVVPQAWDVTMSSTGALIATSCEHDFVTAYSSYGNVLWRRPEWQEGLSGPPTGSDVEEFNCPSGLLVFPKDHPVWGGTQLHDRVAVADHHNHRIQILKAETGDYLDQKQMPTNFKPIEIHWISSGFANMTAIMGQNFGTGMNYVRLFDADLVEITDVGSYRRDEANSSVFHLVHSRPFYVGETARTTLALSDGRFLVAHTDQVDVFAPIYHSDFRGYEKVAQWGGVPSHADGSFYAPRALTELRSGRIVVANSIHCSDPGFIQVLEADGTFVQRFGKGCPANSANPADHPYLNLGYAGAIRGLAGIPRT